MSGDINGCHIPGELIQFNSLISIHVHTPDHGNNFSIPCVVSVHFTEVHQRIIGQEVVSVHIDRVEARLVTPVKAVDKFFLELLCVQVELYLSFEQESYFSFNGAVKHHRWGAVP